MPELVHIQKTDFNSVIWEISESIEMLQAGIPLSDFELEYLGELKSELRKRQWLSYRNALMSIHDNTHIPIEYLSNGKPFLTNQSNHISVSHSGNYAQAISSAGKRVGVDIEVYSDKAFRVRHKFMSKLEIENAENRSPEKIAIYTWCAKEAMYKAMGLEGVIFAEDMTLFDFDFHSFSAKGKFQFKKATVNFDIFFMDHTDFISAMCCETS